MQIYKGENSGIRRIFATLRDFLSYFLPSFQMMCSEVEQEDEEGFDEVLRKFRTIVSLDPWYGAVINMIRREIPGELNSLR